MKKKLIFVAAPPACGKTYVSQRIAEAVPQMVYLDKDDLCDLLLLLLGQRRLPLLAPGIAFGQMDAIAAKFRFNGIFRQAFADFIRIVVQ